MMCMIRSKRSASPRDPSNAPLKSSCRPLLPRSMKQSLRNLATTSLAFRENDSENGANCRQPRLPNAGQTEDQVRAPISNQEDIDAFRMGFVSPETFAEFDEFDLESGPLKSSEQADSPSRRCIPALDRSQGLLLVLASAIICLGSPYLVI
mmetsp:Transcript_2915/g.7614  ORF Transcript_2915/g.7614 Transcript_2915/m.7614 type:complete len:151 (-) Transcript_2915:667-1119(-)